MMRAEHCLAISALIGLIGLAGHSAPAYAEAPLPPLPSATHSLHDSPHSVSKMPVTPKLPLPEGRLPVWDKAPPAQLPALLPTTFNPKGSVSPSPQATPTAPLSATIQANAPLMLSDVLNQVKQHHPKLFGADLERRIAGAKLVEKQGAFDPGINLESDYLRYNDFIKKGNVSTTLDTDLSLNWTSRSGIKFFTGARQNSGDVKPPLYPTGNTGEYFMGVKMPLLRGFRVNEKSVAEMQAQLGIPLADATFNQTRLDTLQKAAISYWDWVGSHQKRRVFETILGLAQERKTMVDSRQQAGDLPAIDLVEATQEVFRRQGGLVKAEREYQKQVFKLSLFLWDSDGRPSPLPDMMQVPRQLEAIKALTPDDWMEGRYIALENRPELKALNLQKSITEVDLKLAKNMQLPVMDLNILPGYDTGGQSIGATAKAGVSMMVPLRNRTARGLRAAAEFKLQKLDMDQRLQLQQILLQVDDAYSAVSAAYEQYTLAQQEYAFAKRLEEGERSKFTYGDSTLFLVNQRERASAEAAIKLIDLDMEVRQAHAIFRIVCGQDS